MLIVSALVLSASIPSRPNRSCWTDNEQDGCAKCVWDALQQPRERRAMLICSHSMPPIGVISTNSVVSSRLPKSLRTAIPPTWGSRCRSSRALWLTDLETSPNRPRLWGRCCRLELCMFLAYRFRSRATKEQPFQSCSVTFVHLPMFYQTPCLFGRVETSKVGSKTHYERCTTNCRRKTVGSSIIDEKTCIFSATERRNGYRFGATRTGSDPKKVRNLRRRNT